MRAHWTHLWFLGWRPPKSINSPCPKMSTSCLTWRVTRLEQKDYRLGYHCDDTGIFLLKLIKRHLIYQPALMLVWIVCRSFLPLSLLPSLPHSFHSSPSLSLNYPCIHACIHASMHASIHPCIHPSNFRCLAGLVLGAHSYLLFCCHVLQAVQEIPALLKRCRFGLGWGLGGGVDFLQECWGLLYFRPTHCCFRIFLYVALSFWPASFLSSQTNFKYFLLDSWRFSSVFECEEVVIFPFRRMAAQAPECCWCFYPFSIWIFLSTLACTVSAQSSRPCLL